MTAISEHFASRVSLFFLRQKVLPAFHQVTTRFCSTVDGPIWQYWHSGDYGLNDSQYSAFIFVPFSLTNVLSHIEVPGDAFVHRSFYQTSAAIMAWTDLQQLRKETLPCIVRVIQIDLKSRQPWPRVVEQSQCWTFPRYVCFFVWGCFLHGGTNPTENAIDNKEMRPRSRRWY